MKHSHHDDLHSANKIFFLWSVPMTSKIILFGDLDYVHYVVFLSVLYCLLFSRESRTTSSLLETILKNAGKRFPVFPCGFHLGKLSSGQEQTESLMSSDRELTRQKKLSCPFPSWGKLAFVETSLKGRLLPMGHMTLMKTDCLTLARAKYMQSQMTDSAGKSYESLGIDWRLFKSRRSYNDALWYFFQVVFKAQAACKD